MLKYSIFAPIFPIIVYSYVIYLTYIAYQNFSVSNSGQKPWNSPNVYPHPMPFQVPPKISLPLAKNLPPKCNRQIQKLITHKQIILFSSNSFAILSIPYSKFKIMHRPTSPRQHKKTQKDLKTKGKAFSMNSKFHFPLPTKANNPLVELSLLLPNLNHQATQEPTIPAHLDRQDQNLLNKPSEISQAIAEAQSLQPMPIPKLNNNNYFNEHCNSNHQNPFIPKNVKFDPAIPLSNNIHQLNTTQHVQQTSINTHNEIPLAIDQQIQNPPEEPVKRTIQLSGKPFQSNPISNPICETHITTPIFIPTPTHTPNPETPLSQPFPFPTNPATINPNYKTPPNAPTFKPLNFSSQYESSPSANRITTNPFSEPLSLQVPSTSLLRHQSPETITSPDASKVVTAQPTLANLPSKTADDQQYADSIPNNRTNSNHPHIEPYLQTNLTRSNANTYHNIDNPWLTISNDAKDNIYTNTKNTKDSDPSKYNNNTVVSEYNWRQSPKVPNSTALRKPIIINNHTPAPKQEAGTGAPATCKGTSQSHAPDPITAINTSKSQYNPTEIPNRKNPKENPKVNPTEKTTPAMSPPPVARSHTPHTAPITTPAPSPTHPQPSQCHPYPSLNPNSTSLPPLPQGNNTFTTQPQPYIPLTNEYCESPSLSQPPSSKKHRINPVDLVPTQGLPYAQEAIQGDPQSPPPKAEPNLNTPGKCHTPPPISLPTPLTPANHTTHAPPTLPRITRHITSCPLIQARTTLLYTHINPNRTAQDALRPLTPQPLHPLSPTPLHINNGHPPHSWNLSVNYHDPHTVLLSPHLRPHHSPDICPSSTKDGWSPYTTQSMTSATSSTYGNNTYSYISTTS
jgi:hypothetical protein